MDPLLKLAEECAELTQVAIKLAHAKSKERKQKFLRRFQLERKDVLNALKATAPVISAITQTTKPKGER
jgi:hypothetical protein